MQIIEWLNAHWWACVVLYLIIGIGIAVLTFVVVARDATSEDDYLYITPTILLWPIALVVIFIVVVFITLPEMLIARLRDETKDR